MKLGDEVTVRVSGRDPLRGRYEGFARSGLARVRVWSTRTGRLNRHVNYYSPRIVQELPTKPHEMMRVRKIMQDYKTGDELSWEAEFQWLRIHHADRLREVAKIVLTQGFKAFEDPILLGDDGRIWDGHHRIYIAYYFGIELVPVRRSNA